jgi:hypothetical protein
MGKIVKQASDLSEGIKSVHNGLDKLRNRYDMMFRGATLKTERNLKQI